MSCTVHNVYVWRINFSSHCVSFPSTIMFLKAIQPHWITYVYIFQLFYGASVTLHVWKNNFSCLSKKIQMQIHKGFEPFVMPQAHTLAYCGFGPMCANQFLLLIARNYIVTNATMLWCSIPSLVPFWHSYELSFVCQDRYSARHPLWLELTRFVENLFLLISTLFFQQE